MRNLLALNSYDPGLQPPKKNTPQSTPFSSFPLTRDYIWFKIIKKQMEGDTHMLPIPANTLLANDKSLSSQKPSRKSEKMKQLRSLSNLKSTRGEYNRIIGESLEEEKARQSFEKDNSRELTLHSLDLIRTLLDEVKVGLER